MSLFSLLKKCSIAAVLFSLCFGNPVGAKELSGMLQVRCRDAYTGASVSSSMQFLNGEAVTFEERLPDSGMAYLSLGAQRYKVRIEASQYQSLRTELEITAQSTMPVTLWLDPVKVPETLSSEMIELLTLDDQGLIHGYLYDKNDGQPIPWAIVSLAKLGLEAEADEGGYFRLFYPVNASAEDTLPPVDNLIISNPGYKKLTIGPLFIHGGDTFFIEDLEPGQGEISKLKTHKLLAEPEELELSQIISVAEEGVDLFNPDLGSPAENAESTSGLLNISPPSTIRVGTSCSCTTCSSVSVMSLETYVRRGLNDEWIASWSSHSLQSGAIAYRSYGAYYVAHPIKTSYDICSTTCCQVNDSDTSSSTNTAVNATAGFMLQRNNAVFRAEYSAENNSWNDPYDGLSCANDDLSCGDGSVGSPAYSWPCLYDQVALGHGCFGHGRGMSQWGTQRWANTMAKTWPWITNHYYNASGQPSGLRSAYITSPLSMQSVSFSPQVVAPGETFIIYVTGVNSSELTHTALMIGASLYSTATGYINDPVHDDQENLPVGTHSLARQFTVPASTDDGLFDLLVSFYYDVNDDNLISPADMALSLTTLSSALT
ncbi:SpoIID/LytB domain-containing protein, partial [candidate division CSSED10-310 bacterium]